jgi:hypothetical protein
MTERQKFAVLKKYSKFELRRYEPCVVAEVSVENSYQLAGQSAFRDLFRYISKGNQLSESIAMTAPVIAATQGEISSNKWVISFVMPSGSSLSELPLPNNEVVRLRELPSEDCVVLSFSGRASQKSCERRESELRAGAQGENIVLGAETRICRFDPPFKPWFLHYNEIVIPIAQGTKL